MHRGGGRGVHLLGVQRRAPGRGVPDIHPRQNPPSTPTEEPIPLLATEHSGVPENSPKIYVKSSKDAQIAPYWNKPAERGPY